MFVYDIYESVFRKDFLLTSKMRICAPFSPPLLVQEVSKSFSVTLFLARTRAVTSRGYSLFIISSGFDIMSSHDEEELLITSGEPCCFS